jgi:HAMP domain-containing protein
MSSTDDGHPLLPSPATEVEHVEQEVRRQVKLLLLRLENLIQQARVKGAKNE